MDDRCLATRRHQARNLRSQSSLSEEMIESAPRVLQGLMDALRASSHLRVTYQVRAIGSCLSADLRSPEFRGSGVPAPSAVARYEDEYVLYKRLPVQTAMSW